MKFASITSPESASQSPQAVAKPDPPCSQGDTENPGESVPRQNYPHPQGNSSGDPFRHTSRKCTASTNNKCNPSQANPKNPCEHPLKHIKQDERNHSSNTPGNCVKEKNEKGNNQKSN